MPDSKPPFYVPLATKRTKLAINAMSTGIVVLIDVINSEKPFDRTVARCWTEPSQSPGAEIVWFENGPRLDRTRYGELNEVRALLAQSMTIV